MQTRQPFHGLIGLLACLVYAATAQANLTLFSDKATFLAATGARPASTIPTTPDTVFPPGAGFASESLSFTLVPGVSTRFSILDFSVRLAGNELALSERESFNVDITTGQKFSFGFDFVEPELDPNGGTFVESTFEVTLKNGATTSGSFLFERPNDSAQFVGVRTGLEEGFDRVEIREVIGDIDNEFFGQFYTYPYPLVGDYNFNGTVDARDYVVWRKASGSSATASPADGDLDGDVDQADYHIWRAHFGETAALLGAGASLLGRTVPETSALCLASFTIAVACAATNRLRVRPRTAARSARIS
jgi:hypothetical protein